MAYSSVICNHLHQKQIQFPFSLQVIIKCLSLCRSNFPLSLIFCSFPWMARCRNVIFFNILMQNKSDYIQTIRKRFLFYCCRICDAIKKIKNKTNLHLADYDHGAANVYLFIEIKDLVLEARVPVFFHKNRSTYKTHSILKPSQRSKRRKNKSIFILVSKKTPRNRKKCISKDCQIFRQFKIDAMFSPFQWAW